jgi:hypothetical protein
LVDQKLDEVKLTSERETADTDRQHSATDDSDFVVVEIVVNFAPSTARADMSYAVIRIVVQLVNPGHINQDTIMRGGGTEGRVVASGPDRELALLLSDDGESRLQVRCGLGDENARRLLPHGMIPARRRSALVSVCEYGGIYAEVAMGQRTAAGQMEARGTGGRCSPMRVAQIRVVGIFRGEGCIVAEDLGQADTRSSHTARWFGPWFRTWFGTWHKVPSRRLVLCPIKHDEACFRRQARLYQGRSLVCP